MAKRFSAQRALQLIWEESEAWWWWCRAVVSNWSSKGPLWLQVFIPTKQHHTWSKSALFLLGWNENPQPRGPLLDQFDTTDVEVSECEDHISNSDFEEENEIEHQPVPKQRRAPGPALQRKARMWYQRSSWTMMSPKELWTTWTRWWLPTAAKGGPYTGHWWYSYWKSLHTTHFSSGWYWSHSGTEGSSREDASSRGTGKGTGKTSNPEKTACSMSPRLCSHHEEESGGECWRPIHPTHRTTITFSLSCVNWPEWVKSIVKVQTN